MTWPKATIPVNCIGGRLKYSAEQWHLVTNDPWVLQTVRNGLIIAFSSPPFQRSMPRSAPMGECQSKICNDEVDSLLKKGATVVVQDNSDGFYSSLFVIPKKSGGFRPIINLKPLNEFIIFEHFKMEGIGTLKEIIRPGDWMVSLDLKDAYLTVPIALSNQKYLRFIWQNVAYQFICLPFGLGPAPRVFTKLLRPVVSYLRSQGIRRVIYLDDILILNEKAEKVKSDMATSVNVIQKLGFLINWEKSETEPSQEITYLGLKINSIDMTFALPEKKVREIVDLCSNLSKTGQASPREMQSLLGHLNWASHAIPHARARYRSLQQDLRTQISLSRILISPYSTQELEW